MTNKYRGWCSRCGAEVAPGAGSCEKVDGKWIVSHAGKCPQAPEGVVLSSAPARTGEKTNRKPGACERCGRWLEPGDGMLVFCMEDGSCMKHFDHSGYHLYCSSSCSEECGAERARQVAEAKARQEIESARGKREDALRNAVVSVANHRGDASPDAGERHVVYSAPGGSTSFVMSDGAIWWIESSCDDYHAWCAPRTPEIDALAQAVIADLPAKRA